MALTIILAAILMALVVAGLSIGLILTGKSRLRRGCGWSPDKKKDGGSCSVCGSKTTCESEEQPDESNKQPH